MDPIILSDLGPNLHGDCDLETVAACSVLDYRYSLYLTLVRRTCCPHTLCAL
jgi:hypothetical protein